MLGRFITKMPLKIISWPDIVRDVLSSCRGRKRKRHPPGNEELVKPASGEPGVSCRQMEWPRMRNTESSAFEQRQFPATLTTADKHDVSGLPLWYTNRVHTGMKTFNVRINFFFTTKGCFAYQFMALKNDRHLVLRCRIAI